MLKMICLCFYIYLKMHFYSTGPTKFTKRNVT